MQCLYFVHVLVFKVPARKVAAQQHLVGAFGFHQKGQGILAVDGGIERDLSPLVGKGASKKTLAPRTALKGLLEASLLEGRKTASVGHMDVQTGVTVENATEEEMGHSQALVHGEAKNDVEIPGVKERVGAPVSRAWLGVQDNRNAEAFMFSPELFKLRMRQGNAVDVGSDV